MHEEQPHGTPVGPKVRKYIYVVNRRRRALAGSVGVLLVILIAYLVFELNLLDDTVHVEGTITDKFDNRNSTLYRTAWFEINDKRWDAWDEIDDYEVLDHYKGDLEPWCDPLVMCDMTELVVFALFMGVIVGALGVCMNCEKIEVE